VSLGQGNCGADGVCNCALGWAGEDCSQPTVGNTCSLHGSVESSEFPFSYCRCDDGWTGIDCSTHALQAGSAPWGSIFDETVYYDDKYGDDHPVWNISVLATIRVEIDEELFRELLLPVNLYNETYAPATVHFDNGVVQETLDSVGFKVKGQGGRMDQKKGWAMKFNEFVDKQELKSVKKIGLKGCSEDDSFIKIKYVLYVCSPLCHLTRLLPMAIRVATDLYRAMGVPSQRASYALLYVNSVFMGLYFMHEDIGGDFLESRFPGDGSGNLMQLYYNVHLGYFGSDDTYYREKVHVNSLGEPSFYAVITSLLFRSFILTRVISGYPMHFYDQTVGNNDWTDFIDFLYFINCTSDADFLDGLETRINVDHLLKSMGVESFLLSSDNIAGGNNMYFYHQTEGSAKDQMSLFTYDFESVFIFDKSTNEPTQDPDIFSFFLTLDRTDYEDVNPLLNRMITLGQHNETYLEYYSTFLNSVFGSDSKQQPADRFAAILQFLYPWAARDYLWQMSYDITPDQFVLVAERSIANFPLRVDNVTAQLEAYSAALVVTP
jgi:spore coat protein CotH